MTAITSSGSGMEAGTPFHERVRSRFGVLPNFFRLAPETPEVAESMWGFALFAYLDNPFPSLFKERLFVYLSRFCCVRYCIARHTGFLLGLGRPAGDPGARILKPHDVVRMLKRRLCHGTGLVSSISVCADYPSPLVDMPEADTLLEQAIFALASHVFLQTEDAQVCLETLERLLGPVRIQYLMVFLTFVRAAHYWTEVHTELKMEDDIKELLRTEEALAECILGDPEARTDAISAYVLEELPELRRRADRKAIIATAIVSCSEDAIISTDLNGIVTTWNQSAERLFGYIAQEAIGQHISLILPLNRRDEETGIIGRILRGDRIAHMDTVRVRKDGTEVEVSQTVSPIRDADGRIIGLSKIERETAQPKQIKAGPGEDQARRHKVRREGAQSRESSRSNIDPAEPDPPSRAA